MKEARPPHSDEPGDVKVVQFVFRFPREGGTVVEIDEVVLYLDGSTRDIPKGPKPDSRAGTVGKMWRGT